MCAQCYSKKKKRPNCQAECIAHMEIEECGEHVIFLMASVFFKLCDCWQLLLLSHVLRVVPESVFLTLGLSEWHTRHSWQALTQDTSLDSGTQSGRTNANVSLVAPRTDAEGIRGGLTQHCNIWTLCPPAKRACKTAVGLGVTLMVLTGTACTHMHTQSDSLPPCQSPQCLPPSRGGLLCTAATDHQR